MRQSIIKFKIHCSTDTEQTQLAQKWRKTQIKSDKKEVIATDITEMKTIIRYTVNSCMPINWNICKKWIDFGYTIYQN